MTEGEGKKMPLCSTCILDASVPDIVFDASGECNYCKLHASLEKDYPLGEKGRADFEKLAEEIRKKGKGKPYDCIVGVSGGTDSTYLLLLAKEYGLRPLAVNVDNGWHSDIAISNIRKSLSILGIDLRTYVIDWQEMRNIHLAFLRASLPWPDGSTDIAIVSALYRMAAKENIRYVLIGHDFRSEGKQPLEWTYTDGKMVKAITEKFARIKIKSFPNLTLFDYLYYGFLKKTTLVRPYWYIKYHNPLAQEIIKEKLGWQYYGGHHHENLFTKFIIAYWLPEKFGIDKRKVTLSAYVRSGFISREQALLELEKPPYESAKLESDRSYVLKKLEITGEEFDSLMHAPNKSFRDYPSYYPLYQKWGKWLKMGIRGLFRFKPLLTYDSDKK